MAEPQDIEEFELEATQGRAPRPLAVDIDAPPRPIQPRKPDPQALARDTMSDSATDELRELTREAREGWRRADAAEQERRREVEPLQRELIRDLGRPRPQGRDVAEQLRPLPPVPRQEFQQGLQEWVGVAAIMGILGGFGGRTAAVNSLTAFAGAVQGFTQGSKEAFEANYKKWEEETAAVEKYNDQLIKQYKLVIESDKLNSDQKKMQLQLIAQMHEDTVTYESARVKGLTELARNLYNFEWHQAKMSEATTKLQTYIEKFQETARENRERDLNRRERLELDKEKAHAGALDDETKDFYADQMLQGNYALPAGIARGPQGRKDISEIMRRFQEKANEAGYTPTQISHLRQNFLAGTAGLRAALVQEVRVAFPLNEMRASVQYAKESFDKLGNGPLPRWNETANSFITNVGDPRTRDLAIKINAVVLPYAAAMTRGTGQSTVQGRKDAREVLEANFSPAQFHAALDALMLEAETALGAARQTREQLLEGASPGAQPQSGARPANPAVGATPDNPLGFTR